jgi:hypothetical protein
MNINGNPMQIVRERVPQSSVVFRGIMVLLLLTPPSFADELVLKDGRKIEWLSLKNNGPAYEVETVRGERLLIKKDDVLDITRTNEIPLTGAYFTLDGKKTERINLLQKIDLKRDQAGGSWIMDGGRLVASASGEYARIQVGGFTQVPEEYDVTMTASRLDGNDEIFIGLLAGGKQWTANFDWNRGQISGLAYVDGNGPEISGVGTPGKVFGATPRTVVVMVRKETVIVRVDNKDHFGWRAKWSRITADAAHLVPSKNCLFLGTCNSRFSISQFVLTIPKGSE